MSDSRELAVKYTDEIYVSYSQLGRLLGFSNYDDFWTPIQRYRDENKVALPFGKINGANYFLTLTEPIKAKINNFERKAHDFCLLSRNLTIEFPKESRNILLTPIVKEAVALEKSQMDDLSIKMLLNSLYNEDNQSHSSVVNYLAAIDYYLLGSPLYPDDDFLGGAYQKVLGQEELTEFYRQNDFGKNMKLYAYVRDSEYPFAPFNEIDDLMEKLFDWLENDEVCSPFIHAFVSGFFLDYVKPFAEKNSLMASLLAKDCLAYSMAVSQAFIIPFEKLLNRDFLNTDAYRESKAKCDLTYALLEAIEKLSAYIDEASKQLKALRINEFKEEFSTLSDDEKKIAESQETKIKPTQLSLELIDEKEPQNIVQEKIEVNKKDEVLENKEAVEEKPVKNAEKITVQAKVIDSLDVGSFLSQEGLSKSEIKDYTRYLLERNPDFNKKQAAFLANHCTEGCYYTIQQYKEFARCVYETARTSMDKIASKGYYEKRQFKNKFVYTPVKKG